MFQAISLESDVDDAKLLAFSAGGLIAGVKEMEKAKLELTAIVEPIRDPAGDEPDEERIVRYRYADETMEEHEIRMLTSSDLPRVAESARRELGARFRKPDLRGSCSGFAGSALPRHERGRDAIIGSMNASPIVGVVMGSRSDYEVLLPCLELLREFAIPHEARIVSAHRTPDWLFQYAEQAEPRGLKIIIAAAGGAAHLPGMLAAKTIVPVLAVPVPSTCLQGIDSLLSIVQMPKGVPVATLAIGKPGAANAALLAVAILAGHDPELGNRLRAWRQARSREVLEAELPS